MSFPTYIQKAVELGLLTAEGDKVIDCNKDAVETVVGMSRLIDSIQPTTQSEVEDTTDQEAIVLCRVLSAPFGKARELWADLRVAFGVAHGQSIPGSLWTSGVFRTIGGEIDRTFMGERDSSVISRESLVKAYTELSKGSQDTSVEEFSETIAKLATPETMASYGEAESEWSVALDLLRQDRVRALYNETLHEVQQAGKSKTKLEKLIEFQQSRMMECLGMLQGSLGNQGNAVDAVEALLSPQNGSVSLLDQIMSSREQAAPVSTGIMAMDVDMEGGIRRPGQSQGGRLFTLAARTGVGKTILGVHAFVSMAMQGLTVGFISAELDKAAIEARIWSAATRHLPNTQWVPVGRIESPDHNRENDVLNISQAAMKIQDNKGKMLVEDPWGADVDAVINSLRSMKAKNPVMRAAVIDHFHCLGRHKGAPMNDSGMLEERAYKLVTVAKELSIDLIVLAQMNRVGMDALSSKQPPGTDMIRGTDALAHVSHAVWIVRRTPKQGEDEGTPDKDRPLEFWHSKTRGRQAYWDGAKVQGVKGFIDTSILHMDYGFSSVQRDETSYNF